MTVSADEEFRDERRVLRRLATGSAGLTLALATTATAVFVVGSQLDTALLADALGRARRSPGGLSVAMGAFALAFVIRAVAWRLVLPGLPITQAWSALHVALGANHLLPFRLGEPLRVLSVTRRAGIPLEAAAASTLTLRAADMLTVAGLGLAVAPSAFVSLVGPFGWLVLGLVLVVAAVAWRWLGRLAVEPRAPEPSRPGDLSDRSSVEQVRRPGIGVIALSGSAWLAESVVVWQAARLVGLEVAVTDAVLVATVAVGAQIAAIAPGGFGTYEAASVAAYAALGHDVDAALVAAVAAHGLKTAYSLGIGAVAMVWPGPSLVGRLRLARPRGETSPATAAETLPLASVSDRPAMLHDGGTEAFVTGADGGGSSDHILLFMPAYNEEASVGPCVSRVPDRVLDLPVEVLVIDDGSSDRTAARARAAGAEVVSLEQNLGLGAAVRVGLAEGERRGAAAVVFCDADGEYPPEELCNLVAPILAGQADYVTGSRFLGRIDHMRPHRRLGNIVLTRVLSLVARTRITDGQTGYRAFSPDAAAAAEVIHDFNYAQVLTLDLLAKGFRLREVPISYHFRTEGESFIRLGRYLRSVIPAVYRELNTG